MKGALDGYDDIVVIVQYIIMWDEDWEECSL